MGPFTGEERDSEAVVVEPDTGSSLHHTACPGQHKDKVIDTSIIERTALARQDAGRHEDTGICWKT